MTRTEIRDELDGIQYMIDTINSKLTALINEHCVNPSFRTRLHRVEDKMDEASDQMHFAKHLINDLIFLNSDKEEKQS